MWGSMFALSMFETRNYERGVVWARGFHLVFTSMFILETTPMGYRFVYGL